jgi:hypothetical protein
MAKKAPAPAAAPAPDWIDTFKEWPASAEMVSKEESDAGRDCTLRTVQNWCSKNNVRSIGHGNRYQFLIFREDVLKFRDRDRPGRPWPEKK